MSTTDRWTIAVGALAAALMPGVWGLAVIIVIIGYVAGLGVVVLRKEGRKNA